jgi:hypothetical protein
VGPDDGEPELIRQPLTNSRDLILRSLITNYLNTVEAAGVEPASDRLGYTSPSCSRHRSARRRARPELINKMGAVRGPGRQWACEGDVQTRLRSLRASWAPGPPRVSARWTPRHKPEAANLWETQGRRVSLLECSTRYLFLTFSTCALLCQIRSCAAWQGRLRHASKHARRVSGSPSHDDRQ